MPSCAFDKCRSHSRKLNKTHGITYHSFPHDESWCHKWETVVRRQRREPKWKHTPNSRVCSLHFKPEDMYTTGKERKKIKPGAVPFRTPYAKPSSSDANSSESDNSESDSEPEDKPQSTFMKRKIEKVIADKKRILQVNKNLKRRNKRLIQKCKSLANIVLHLKERVSELESRKLSTK